MWSLGASFCSIRPAAPSRPISHSQREDDALARITLDRLAHSYKAKPRGPEDFALKEIDHVWRQGGAYALLGPSGCGKTTLLNIISGLVEPTHGRILFDDRDVTRLPTEARNIAQVFQFPVVYDTMTVRENLAFPLKNRGVDARAARLRVEEVAELLELTPHLDRRASGLTADAKQKISLGRGLVRPDVAAILFDEPLTVIDPHLKWQLRSTLKELHRKLDLTMIYVTHDQTEALTFADTVVVMHDGAVVQTGAPDELFDRPEHVFVGHFIGSPGMNFLPCRVEGSTAYIDGVAARLSRAYPGLPEGARIELGVRPEFATLAAGGEGLPVRIRRIDDLGRSRIARVELGGRTIAASVAEDASFEGDQAMLMLDPARIHIYADGRRVSGEGAA
jgi:glycerol transport system ATP-binding protein